MKIQLPAVLAFVCAFSQLPIRADISPEAADRLRASVVTIETPDGSSGTGFFVGETGLLVTCAHVLDTGPGKVDLRFLDDSEGVAEFVSFDPIGLDLAVLRVVGERPSAFLELSADAAPRVGQRVFQAGNPHALFPSLMSTGIVGHHRATHHVFVHDAASSGGSSGSPLVDTTGQVLGMTMSTFNHDTEHSTPNGFASAVDVSAIRAFLDRIAAGERSSVKVAHVEYLRYPLPALDPGVTAEGELSRESDRYAGDLSYAQGYRLDLDEGEIVRLTLKSEDFDAYLMLYDDDASLVDSNDDAPGEDVTDSEIVFTVPKSGRYVVVATSFDRGETGSYRLDASAIRFGKPVVNRAAFTAKDAAQDGGAPSRAYPFQGKPGRWISVMMRSTEIDSMLRLIGPDGSQVAENDDWNEETLDSRIIFRIEEPGEYQIIATAFGESQVRGPYELEIAWSEE